jgi:hypothetical protein
MEQQSTRSDHQDRKRFLSFPLPAVSTTKKARGERQKVTMWKKVVGDACSRVSEKG